MRRRTFINLPWLTLEWLPQAPGVFGMAFFLHARPLRVVSYIGGLALEFGEPEQAEGD